MTSQPTTRYIFIWNILGSLSTGLIAFFLLFGVSRFLSVREGDVYSYAYALGNLFSMIGLFQVRNYQATDIEQTYHFNDYLSTRFWTCLLMVVATGCYLIMTKQSVEDSFIIGLVCCYRMTDAVSDVFQGLFQQQERMDLAGQSLFFRNSAMVSGFLVSLFVTKNLLLSLVVLLILSVFLILIFDLRQSRMFFHWEWQSVWSGRILSLLKQCFPLFIIGFLLVYIYNQPKYSLNKLYEQGFIGEGLQRDFNILFMPIFVMSVLMFVLRPIVTTLAIHLAEGRLSDFIALKKRLFLILIAISVLVLVGGSLVALPILELFYGIPLSHYRLDFFLLLLGGVISSFATLFDNLLTIFRRQGLLVISFVNALIVSLVVTDYLVVQYGLLGASLSFLLSMVTWLLSLMVTYTVVFRRIGHEQ